MSSRVLLGIDDPELVASVRASIDESTELEVVGVAASASAIASQCEEGGVDVVLLHEGVGPLPQLHLTNDLVTRFPGIGVVLLVDDPSSELLRGAMQAGARGVTGLPLSVDALEADLAAAAGWAQSVRSRFTSEEAGSSAATARVFAFAGAKGGVGATTVALHLAMEAAGSLGPGRSVCFMDLDLQTGDAVNLLDIEQRRSIVDLLDVADDLTSRHIEEAVFRHASGLHLLLAPAEGEHAEDVTAQHTRQILGALRSRFDIVIVDVGSVATEASLTAVEMADLAVVVATPDVPSMRSANRMLELWRRLEARTEDVHVLVNRASRISDVQPDLVESVVAVPRIPLTIPADYRGLQPAVNAGAPDRANGSPAREAIHGLGVHLGLWPEKRRQKSRRGRLFTRESGQASVELVGILPVALLVIALTFQLGLVGLTFVFSGVASSEAARQLAVGEPVAVARQHAADRLPDRWSGSLTLSTPAPGCEQCSVEVSLAVPSLVPGVAVPIPVRSSTGYVNEQRVGGDPP